MTDPVIQPAKTNRTVLNVVIHVAAWSIFVFLPYLIMTKDAEQPWEIAFNHNPYVIGVSIFSNAYLIGFYYLNSFVLIPRLLAYRRWIIYALLIIALLVIFIWIPDYIFRHYVFTHPHPKHPRLRIFPLPGSAALFLLIFIISSGVKIIQSWFSAEKMKEEAEKERLRTELAFLKTQVNPHFLFNTLNNIYAMAITESAHTADAVMKLSQIMRYMLQEAEHEIVPLQKELEFVQHYIELQQFRLSEKGDIRFSVQGSPGASRIAPLLLIPFIENAFKYGISTRERSRINIAITIQGNVVSLVVENTKHAVAAIGPVENNGIGINNTRRRLALLYPEMHELTIQDGANEFKVSLKITCL